MQDNDLWDAIAQKSLENWGFDESLIGCDVSDSHGLNVLFEWIDK